MHSAEYQVSLHSSKGVLPATLYCWDEAPNSGNHVLLRLETDDRRWEVHANNYVGALTEVRRELESEGVLIACTGADVDVHASGMSASMGVGDKAYRLSLGKVATMADLVCIFGPTKATPSTLAAQEAFYERWLESLGR